MADIEEVKQKLIERAKLKLKDFNEEDWTFETLEWADGTFQITLFNGDLIDYRNKMIYKIEFKASKKIAFSKGKYQKLNELNEVKDGI